MRTIWIVPVIAIILIAGFGFGFNNPVFAQILPPVTVSGQIVDSNNNPIPDLSVAISGPVGESTRTASDGTYSIQVSPGSTYTMFMSRGSAPLSLVPSSFQVSSGLGILTQDIVKDATLPTVTLSGVVRDSNGNPVPGTSVFVNSYGTSFLGFTGIVSGSATSDSTGFYSIKLLPGTARDIIARPPQGSESSTTIISNTPIPTDTTLDITFIVPEPDTDGDGVPDSEDACPGFDDNIDTDGDGIPDGCDANPTLGCGAGTTLVGFECVSSSTLSCGSGTTLNTATNQCEADPQPSQCAFGTTLNVDTNQCEADPVPQISCALGTVLEVDECVVGPVITQQISDLEALIQELLAQIAVFIDGDDDDDEEEEEDEDDDDDEDDD